MIQHTQGSPTLEGIVSSSDPVTQTQCPWTLARGESSTAAAAAVAGGGRAGVIGGASNLIKLFRP